MPAESATAEAYLAQICSGFEEVHAATGRSAVALSFGFPGPAEYEAGVILTPPNLPAFRDVPLGRILRERFELPVFVNNDAALFAAGEARAGVLPWINARSSKQFRNLLGFTLGTGFGGGVCIDGRLLRGDNGSAGAVWSVRHRDRRGGGAGGGGRGPRPPGGVRPDPGPGAPGARGGEGGAPGGRPRA